MKQLMLLLMLSTSASILSMDKKKTIAQTLFHGPMTLSDLVDELENHRRELKAISGHDKFFENLANNSSNEEEKFAYNNQAKLIRLDMERLGHKITQIQAAIEEEKNSTK